MSETFGSSIPCEASAVNWLGDMGCQASATMLERLRAVPGSRAGVDLQAQTVAGPDGESHGFHIEPFPKHCLLQRLDELGYTLTLAARITDVERRHEHGDA